MTGHSKFFQKKEVKGFSLKRGEKDEIVKKTENNRKGMVKDSQDDKIEFLSLEAGREATCHFFDK